MISPAPEKILQLEQKYTNIFEKNHFERQKLLNIQ